MRSSVDLAIQKAAAFGYEYSDIEFRSVIDQFLPLPFGSV